MAQHFVGVHYQGLRLDWQFTFSLITGVSVRRLAGAAGRLVLFGLIGFVPVHYLGMGVAVGQTTAYVTDELEITMRSGEGNEYRIIRLLTSGTQLEVLERGEAWSRVRAGGDTGWVRSVYLQAEPVAINRLDAAISEAEQLREENRELTAALEDAERSVAELGDTSATLQDENQRMQQRLQEAGEGLQLADENQVLRKQVVDLERAVQDLTRENERMADRERQDWFIAGAGVIVVGMIIGILVTRIRWRRRSSWGDL